jgi:hypothetical protein
LRSVTLDPARGLVVNLIAALGSCGAAIVAVVIATDSRRERTAERLDAAKAQAMLVLLNVEVSRGSPAFNVWVRNFGAQAILDVQVDSARFARVPTAKFEAINRLGPTLKVLDADRNRDCLVVKFRDDQGDRARSSAPADWDKLLVSDAQVSDIVGVPGLVTWRPYTTTTSTRVWWRSPTRVRHGGSWSLPCWPRLAATTR